MVPVQFHNVIAERCTDCQGLWFDEFVKEELERLKGSEVLDVGDAKTGKEFNKVDRI